mmetsp:Transcript_38837/g.70733  ORF Transcript_38837/g.70733 Transcript_38837/m.70733 type:complete len:94 (+) Transcript_38837:99-380(+)
MVIHSSTGVSHLSGHVHSATSFLGSANQVNHDWLSLLHTESAAQDISTAVYFAVAAASAATGVLVVAHASGSVSFLHMCGAPLPKEEVCEGRE